MTLTKSLIYIINKYLMDEKPNKNEFDELDVEADITAYDNTVNQHLPIESHRITFK